MQYRRLKRKCSVEPLESRALLSTITVTSLADNQDGEVTLREAVLAANEDRSVDGSVAGSGSDVIKFDPSLAGGTIELQLGELLVTKTLTVDGPSQRIDIDAGNSSRIFNVSETTRFRAQDLRLPNGDADFGGAILTGAKNTFVVRSRLVGNKATESGGAIRTTREEGGLLAIRSTWFNSNEADVASAAISVGSGFSEPTTLEISNAIFRDNVSASGIVSSGVWDGADQERFSFVESTSFRDNDSGTASVLSSPTVRDSQFTGNRGGAVLGGARFVSDSSFEANQKASVILSMENVTDDFGEEERFTDVVDSEFRGNTAPHTITTSGNFFPYDWEYGFNQGTLRGQHLVISETPEPGFMASTTVLSTLRM